MCRTACTVPQCLYKGALYLYLYLFLERLAQYEGTTIFRNERDVSTKRHGVTFEKYLILNVALCTSQSLATESIYFHIFLTSTSPRR